jgi:DNA-binding helix-hairpin-helix protein with protein kinase domain
VRLDQVVGRGGEGTVFAIEGRTDQVAKIYTTSPSSQKVNKLRAMVKMSTPPILNISAWPTDLIIDEKNIVHGFVMPNVKARRDIHELYSPKSRADAFPEVDFRFLIHVGCNICRAFGVIHENGHVLGDVNHGNLLVGPDGTVRLIDCDSFQIYSGSILYSCDVGVPLFTPPELQGKSFIGVIRTQNQDFFGLSILLFHLLYMGRHPFAGRYLGRGDMPIERAIAEFRFAYGPNNNNQMERPPGTLPLEIFGNTIANLFVKAFSELGSKVRRPNAINWISALERLKDSLRVCSQASWHYFPEHLPRCPWCDLEAITAARFFGMPIVATRPEGFIDLETLWKAISSVPKPELDPELPSNLPWSLPPGEELPSRAIKILFKVLGLVLICTGIAAYHELAKNAGFWAAILLFGLAYIVWPRVSSERRAEAQRAYSSALYAWETALSRWEREASIKAFMQKLKALEKARGSLADLPNERRRRLIKLNAEREQRQRQKYLDRFRIDRANIPQIGPARTAMLSSYGIETAADINRSKILQIPGLGNVLTSELINWRKGHESKFRFNPNEPVNPRDIQAMDQELDAMRRNLISILQQGPTTLRRLNNEICAARPRLMPVLQETWSALKLAEAKRNAI